MKYTTLAVLLLSVPALAVTPAQHFMGEAQALSFSINDRALSASVSPDTRASYVQKLAAILTARHCVLAASKVTCEKASDDAFADGVDALTELHADWRQAVKTADAQAKAQALAQSKDQKLAAQLAAVQTAISQIQPASAQAPLASRFNALLASVNCSAKAGGVDCSAAKAGAIDDAAAQAQELSGDVKNAARQTAAEGTDIAHQLSNVYTQIAAIGATGQRAAIGGVLADVASALLCTSPSPGKYDCSKAAGSPAFGSASSNIAGVESRIESLQTRQQSYAASLEKLAGQVAAVPAPGTADAVAKFKTLVSDSKCAPSGSGYDCSKCETARPPSLSDVQQLATVLPASGTPSQQAVFTFMSDLNALLMGVVESR
jgi:hypothetical protein